ncbi:MAG: transferase [Ruminococcaceae bacterium]|nr:transferase [Oscillospiraceae bacterium]
MGNFLQKLFHTKGIHKKINLFLVNKVYADKEKNYKKKRKLLNAIGYDIGEGTRIVTPFYCSAELHIGKNCYVNKNFNVYGNGKVVIGDNCDIAPEVTFFTGGHYIGDPIRRAGKGRDYSIYVGNGTWIGGRSSIFGDISIGNSCVVALGSVVNKDVKDNCLVGGVPAKIIKELDQ